jgi:hypothetical protein
MALAHSTIPQDPPDEPSVSAGSAEAPKPEAPLIFVRPPLDVVRDAWPAISRLLERACERSDGSYTPDAVARQVVQGEATLWLGVTEAGELRFAVLTTIYAEPSGRRVAEISLAAGVNVFAHLDAMYAEVERWAVEYGASVVRIIGRRGWGRRLGGFRDVATVMEKPIGGEA